VNKRIGPAPRERAGRFSVEMLSQSFRRQAERPSPQRRRRAHLHAVSIYLRFVSFASVPLTSEAFFAGEPFAAEGVGFGVLPLLLSCLTRS
jgi:hypothetical protein